MEKQKFIVRCDRAGVFYGEIEGRNGSEVKMRNVRCLWYWEGAATLLQLAAEGRYEIFRCDGKIYPSWEAAEEAIIDEIF